MREFFNALVFFIVVLAILDTLSFSGHYRKAAWQQLTDQTKLVTANIRQFALKAGD